MRECRTQNGGSAPVRTLADAERAHITAALHETNWVVGGRRGAADRLGLPRTTLITMMRRHGIFRETLGQQAGLLDRSLATVPSGQSYG
jgi:formate hydrogenlyase transcriptional activator